MKSLTIALTPKGQLALRENANSEAETKIPANAILRMVSAFHQGSGAGLFHLATAELATQSSHEVGYWRDFARLYLTRLCHAPNLDEEKTPPPIAAPTESELTTLVLQAPPMAGLEYLNVDCLQALWSELHAWVREQSRSAKSVQEFLSAKNPIWRSVGKVTFHLAENRRDPDHPFAFLATFASRLSARGTVQHEPLGRALQFYASAKDKSALLKLLAPVQRATERCPWIKELVDSGAVYQPCVWTPKVAYRFLQDITAMEESGLIVRVPNWWNANRPPRPTVNVSVNTRHNTSINIEALLEFSVGASLNGEQLTEAELAELLQSTGGLVQLKGQWVELDREKLSAALVHWKKVEQQARQEGITFFEGMRLLSGATIESDRATAAAKSETEWVGLTAGPTVAAALQQLRAPEATASAAPMGLRGELRAYQLAGVNWLRFVTGLGLGACLADDMGLGKTIQVIALLLHVKNQRGANSVHRAPSLLVVPASLLGNWKAELDRFAPQLATTFLHSSEQPNRLDQFNADLVRNDDLVITTYGLITRLPWLAVRPWNLVILDEAQTIKNAGTQQANAVKQLRAQGRIGLTGTPVENRLGDLWSLFDFLNPGLLGGPKAFKSLIKRLEERDPPNYVPLRSLVQPYILRRLKTDKRVIADLPEKTEMRTYCGLSRRQAALYEQTVRELAQLLEAGHQGIKRRGGILAHLTKLKQICNHPTQYLGHGDYETADSGKFQRLGELAQELAERQEKALIFTQFREIAEPLSHYLAGLFGRAGLVLHGGTAVAQRRKLVEQFQRDDGPPFFVLSVKAGGTGLNLTSAAHVIHFDRWWNPAVENQATDRAFRIGQRKNVFVHKFVCRGTIEERIDAMIEEKKGLAEELLDGAATLLTEMNDQELLNFVALDLNKAMD